MSEVQAGNIKAKDKLSLVRKAARLALTAAIVGTLATSDTKPNPSFSEPSLQAASEILNRPDGGTLEFIKRVENAYGKSKVDVSLVGFRGQQLVFSPDKFDIDSMPKTVLTAQEISIFEEAIKTVPFCLKITDRFNILKVPGRKTIFDASAVRGTAHTRTTDPRSISDITIQLEEGIDLNSLPEKYSELGLKSYAERLKQLFYHECGHRVSDAILRVAFQDKEYFDMVGNLGSRNDYLIEKKHPFYIPFAKLEGWKLKEDVFIQENPKTRIYIKTNPDNRMVYEKTKSSIEEHFAELFSLYFSNPSILTSQERQFFEKIDKGFRSNPTEFAKQIAAIPMMSLDN